MSGTVIPMMDLLHLGPLGNLAAQRFSEMRQAYWQSVGSQNMALRTVQDDEQILAVAESMHRDEQAVVWVWGMHQPQDVCLYYWCLPYLTPFGQRLLVVDLSGLPFLDQGGKLFFPNVLSVLPARELQKARHLARPVTPTEAEAHMAYWAGIVAANGGVRILKEGRHIESHGDDYYDEALISTCGERGQRMQKIVRTLLRQQDWQVPEEWLYWRVQALVAAGRLEMVQEEVRIPMTPATQENTAKAI